MLYLSRQISELHHKRITIDLAEFLCNSASVVSPISSFSLNSTSKCLYSSTQTSSTRLRSPRLLHSTQDYVQHNSEKSKPLRNPPPMAAFLFIYHSQRTLRVGHFMMKYSSYPIGQTCKLLFLQLMESITEGTEFRFLAAWHQFSITVNFNVFYYTCDTFNNYLIGLTFCQMTSAGVVGLSRRREYLLTSVTVSCSCHSKTGVFDVSLSDILNRTF